MSTQQLNDIAYQVRLQFEERSINTESLIALYRKYTDVGDTVRFVAQAQELFPIGNCGLAALYIQRELGGEIVRGKYGEHDHTFLLVDATVVDITADQFGGPSVYVGPLQAPWALKPMPQEIQR